MEKTVKQDVIKNNQTSKEDTGSSQVQVALLSEEIKNLSKHMIDNPKDLHSRRGLLLMLAKRKRLLKYLARVDAKGYAELIKKLGLRK